MYALGILEKEIDQILKINLSDRLPSKFIRIIECDKPIPQNNEVQVKLLGCGLNFNSVWQSICHPINPRDLISSHIRRNPTEIRHFQDFYIFGSDGAGIVSAVGADVSNWKVGDEVVLHCNVVNSLDQTPDQMKSKSQSIWGYETNYGSFAEYTCVKETQLVKKPDYLDWASAGSYMLTGATAYRMLASMNGANIKKDEFCLIWGASGGLGSFAIQLCNLIGAIPIGVVSNKAKGEYCKSIGCKFVIDLSEITFKSPIKSSGEPDYMVWKQIKNFITRKIKNEIDVVFEHIGRDTLGLSIYLLKKGGKVVTCAASSGYLSSIDLRYLWMDVKQIIGSHFANFNEINEFNQLVFDKKVNAFANTIIDFKDIPSYLDKMLLRENNLGKIAARINFK